MTLIVSQNQEEVENNLKTGLFLCPFCNLPLKRHGHAKTRYIRSTDGRIAITPRRSRCPKCKITQVLLPETLLIRRVDSIKVIGETLVDKANGISISTIAKSRNIPFTTVRGWIRRVIAKADQITQYFNSVALSLDASLNNIIPSGSKFKDAIDAIGRTLMTSRLRLGDLREWSLVVRLTGGKLLFNTNSPFKIPP